MGDVIDAKIQQHLADEKSTTKQKIESPKRVRLSQLKPVLTGEIDLDDVTLSVDKDAVDATFGLGVYDRYLRQAEQLSDKFLGLTDVTVVYEKKSRKCLMIH